MTEDDEIEKIALDAMNEYKIPKEYEDMIVVIAYRAANHARRRARGDSL